MLAAMTAPVPRLPLQVEGGSVLAGAAGARLPPLCVGKWRIDRYEADESRGLKETAHLGGGGGGC